MDVGKAFTYVTEDERWITKIAIGAAITLLGFLIIPMFLLPGYLVQITRNVRDGMEKPLPEWDNWGQLLIDGLTIFAAQLVYTLPFWLLMCIGAIATGAFGSLANASEEVAAAGLLATFGVVGCLMVLLMIAMFFIMPAIVIQYVREEDFAACFRFGEVIAIARDNIGDIVIVAAASFGISFIVGSISTLLSFTICVPFVLALASGPYISMVTGHMYGQIAHKIDKSNPMKFAA